MGRFPRGVPHVEQAAPDQAGVVEIQRLAIVDLRVNIGQCFQFHYRRTIILKREGASLAVRRDRIVDATTGE